MFSQILCCMRVVSVGKNVAVKWPQPENLGNETAGKIETHPTKVRCATWERQLAAVHSIKMNPR